jgi:hypothetical protein
MNILDLIFVVVGRSVATLLAIMLLAHTATSFYGGVRRAYRSYTSDNWVEGASRWDKFAASVWDGTCDFWKSMGCR